jgi:hypothetical protein
MENASNAWQLPSVSWILNAKKCLAIARYFLDQKC